MADRQYEKKPVGDYDHIQKTYINRFDQPTVEAWVRACRSTQAVIADAQCRNDKCRAQFPIHAYTALLHYKKRGANTKFRPPKFCAKCFQTWKNSKEKARVPVPPPNARIVRRKPQGTTAEKNYTLLPGPALTQWELEQFRRKWEDRHVTLHFRAGKRTFTTEPAPEDLQEHPQTGRVVTLSKQFLFLIPDDGLPDQPEYYFLLDVERIEPREESSVTWTEPTNTAETQRTDAMPQEGNDTSSAI